MDSDCWLKFNANKRTFYGTPEVKDLGSFSVMLVVDDNYKEITSNFTFDITNSAPELSIPLS